jgi:hypothetical protein
MDDPSLDFFIFNPYPRKGFSFYRFLSRALIISLNLKTLLPETLMRVLFFFCRLSAFLSAFLAKRLEPFFIF